MRSSTRSHQSPQAEAAADGNTGVNEYLRRNRRPRGRRFKVLVISALVVGAVSTLGASPAEASVSSCGNGRCTIYLSKSETYDLGQFRVPTPPSSVPGQLRAAYYAAAYGHSWFARQYASQGKCSAFTVSIYPWETQGYYGYSCNWN